MKRKIKIVTVDIDSAEGCTGSEKTIEKYVNNSWEIMAAGSGMVILEKDILETSG